MKVCRSLWSVGVPLGLEECRKWLFDVEGEPRRLGDILSDVKESWKQIVILNQLLHVSKNFEELEEVLERIMDAPLAFIINLRKYYPELKDVKALIDVPHKKTPEYLSSTKTVIDFFLNYLKFEEGGRRGWSGGASEEALGEGGPGGGVPETL